MMSSNKPSKVADLAASSAADHLGDFQDGTNSGDDYDYGYDGNDNVTSDQNKKITGISYNILNLPSVITVAGAVPLNITMMHPATSCRSAPQIIPPVPIQQSPPISVVPSTYTPLVYHPAVPFPEKVIIIHFLHIIQLLHPIGIYKIYPYKKEK